MRLRDFPVTRAPGLMGSCPVSVDGSRLELHNQALRALANRLLGTLHECLKDRTTIDQTAARQNMRLGCLGHLSQPVTDTSLRL